MEDESPTYGLPPIPPNFISLQQLQQQRLREQSQKQQQQRNEKEQEAETKQTLLSDGDLRRKQLQNQLQQLRGPTRPETTGDPDDLENAKKAKKKERKKRWNQARAVERKLKKLDPDQKMSQEGASRKRTNHKQHLTEKDIARVGGISLVGDDEKRSKRRGFGGRKIRKNAGGGGENLTWVKTGETSKSDGTGDS